jgi:hypothetical protein
MFQRTGIVSMICLTAFFLSGATAPQSCTNSQPLQIGPSKGEVIGLGVAAVGVIVIGTVVLVEVHKSHHTIKGCVTAGPAGIQVIDTGNTRTYNVTGVTANVKVGDTVRLHGNKQKKIKGEPAQNFVIEKLSKDYGPCKLSLAPRTPAAATRAP